jgi:NADH-quinone oxidoreductase subunit N
MAGLPPLGGFVSKLMLYVVAIEAKLDFVVFFSLLLSLVSTYYYLNFVHYLGFVNFTILKLYFVNLTKGLNLFLDAMTVFLLFFIFLLPISYIIIARLALSCV